MEIERKWMVKRWPEETQAAANLPLLYTELQEQGYLHTSVPVVRIRREERITENAAPAGGDRITENAAPAGDDCICAAHDGAQSTTHVQYILCFKSAGRLARQEIEMEISKEKFLELKEMIGHPLIQKVRKVYALPDGLSLEVNLVDEGLPSQFMYAEVEYDSIESAKGWDPASVGLGSYLNDDVTNQPGQSMSAYWVQTRQNVL